ncbi:MAG: acyl-CoA/acyl-ACP dehydrogenase [Chlorobi bacterium]|nr:acyl-CoA/acyl-ACP dehydrogenase [Chlorobiota bacterium]
MSINELLTKEDLALRDKVRDFVKWVPRQLLLDMDADKVRYPMEFIREAGKRNLLGLRFDKKLGGSGLPWTSEMVALEEVGVLGTSLGCLYSLISIVGEAIHVFGTEEQKQRFLVPMLKGETGVAEGLTEPRGGSDFFAATTKATRKGDMFYLNGQKRFVVGAEGADLLLVYAIVDGIEDPKKAMTAFLVERGPGVEVKHVYGLMGTRGGGTGRLVFKDAAVPLENVLGGEDGIGNGTRVFHQMMVPERLTSAGAAVGMARGAFEVAARYADKRKAFGQKIRAFEAVSAKVSDSLTLLDASRAINYLAAKTADAPVTSGEIRRMVSEAKKFSTEAAWKVVNHAMQIMGGIGYTNIYPVEKMLRDTRLITIWTGTNEIMDLVIQHEFYKEFLAQGLKGRDIENDAEGAGLPDEKIYND